MLILLVGCASREDRELDARLKKLEEETRISNTRAQIAVYVANQCDYAKDDPIHYGDCVRQTRQFLFEQMQAENARQFEQARQIGQYQGAAAAQFIRQQPIQQPPRSITCQTFGSGSQASTTCN